MAMKVGENYRAYGENLGSYFTEGWKEKDPIKLAAAPFMAVGSVLGEGLEPLAAGVVDQKLERPQGVIGRTKRDLAALAKDIVTLHPLRAVRDAFSLVTSDVPLDVAELVIGYHQGGTRSRAQKTLHNTETQYSLSA